MSFHFLAGRGDQPAGQHTLGGKLTSHSSLPAVAQVQPPLYPTSPPPPLTAAQACPSAYTIFSLSYQAQGSGIPVSYHSIIMTNPNQVI